MTLIGIINSGSFGKLFPEHLEALKKFSEIEFITVNTNEPNEIISKLQNCDGIIASTTPIYNQAILNSLPKLKIICRHGTGYNNIDTITAKRNNILVSRTPGEYAANSMAEYTLGLILAGLRKIPQGVNLAQSGKWKERNLLIGSELANKTVGIIGLGNIAKRLIHLLSIFNCKIIYFSPKTKLDNLKNCELVTLDKLYQTSDIISLHCSSNPTTYHLINENSLKQIKKNCILINTARGELVDHQALIKCINAGQVINYLTDVVEGEPIFSEHELFHTPGISVLPHIGGYSQEFLKIMGDVCVKSMSTIFNNTNFEEAFFVNL